MGVISLFQRYGYFSVTNGSRPTGSPFVSLLYPISGALSIVSHRCPGQFCKKPQGGGCHRQSFQKPKWSSIPRQCAHWHGICWMRGCFRRKRRNPAPLYQVRAGRILKEGGASRSESNLTIAGGNRSLIISDWFAGANLSVPP